MEEATGDSVDPGVYFGGYEVKAISYKLVPAAAVGQQRIFFVSFSPIFLHLAHEERKSFRLFFSHVVR